MKPQLLALTLLAPFAASAQQRPNVIIIFTDDQGYNDLGCYGSELISTPNIDAMAERGMRFTDFYVSSSISSASRAGLLTGRYNSRNSATGVFWPGDDGMNSEEITIAEALKEVGYNTACYGKWHLGDTEGHLPVDQGFDDYFGIPYSNDMFLAPNLKLSEDIVLREGFTLEMVYADQEFAATSKIVPWEIATKLNYRAPLLDGREVVEFPCDQSSLTRRYFDRAIDFIESCGDAPFFAYITPAMPHWPLSASEQFKGTSRRGLYGDVIEEIDWNVGRLLDYLDESHKSENTLVIYTSDNGPWLIKGEDGGSAAPLRDGKATFYEGGVRVPCIMQWPGVIPAQSKSESIVTSIDIFPTIMHYAGVDKEFDIDGVNASKVLEKPSASVRNTHIYIKYGEMIGVRHDDWVYLPYSGATYPAKDVKPELFNLKEDISQSKNLYDSEPKVAKRMQRLFDKLKSEL